MLECSAQADNDLDGLPNTLEFELGSDINSIDTDGDGLSDFAEAYKYKTNLLEADTDGDGTQDGEWDERRESTYTIRAVVDLRPPFDIVEMNDHYQDARLISENGDGSTRCEVIVYPNAKVFIDPGEFRKASNSIDYTESTYTKKNYTDTMVSDMANLIVGSHTDLQVLYKVLGRFSEEMSYVDPVEDLGYESTLPILFHMYKDESGNIVTEKKLAKSNRLTIDELKDRIVYADSMYKHGVHGACGSTSVLKGAMFRAAGLEERTLFAIPLMFSYDVDDTKYNISSPYNYGHVVVESENSSSISDHFYHEVKIGNNWIRVDGEAQQSLLQGLTSDVYKTKIYIKLLDSIDITDDNYYTTWNYRTWNEKRGGYIFRSVEESYGDNM